MNGRAVPTCIRYRVRPEAREGFAALMAREWGVFSHLGLIGPRRFLLADTKAEGEFSGPTERCLVRAGATCARPPRTP